VLRRLLDATRGTPTVDSHGPGENNIKTNNTKKHQKSKKRARRADEPAETVEGSAAELKRRQDATKEVDDDDKEQQQELLVVEVARQGASDLLAVDREIDLLQRQKGQKQGPYQQHSKKQKKKKKKRIMAHGEEVPQTNRSTSIASAASAAAETGAAMACGRSSASYAMRAPQHVPTVVRKEHLKQLRTRELNAIARKLRRHVAASRTCSKRGLVAPP
jgi:hypothetical protein